MKITKTETKKEMKKNQDLIKDLRQMRLRIENGQFPKSLSKEKSKQMEEKASDLIRFLQESNYNLESFLDDLENEG